MADPQAAPSFLRAIAQRAGHLVLAPPRLALDALTRALPDALRPASLATAPGAAGGGTLAGNNLGDPAPASASSASASASTTTAASPGMALPSPVTYLTSPYLFTSLALAFFLHRIHHLVPPRTSLVAHSTLAHPRVMRPAVQVGLRLPGLLLMLRTALALACALALHAGHPLDWLSRAHSPAPDARTVAATLARTACTLVTWATAWAGRGALGRVLAAASPADVVAALDHHALLWATYVAASVGLTCETFVRALSDDLPNVQHFNLLSFSFLLHVHSAPLRGRSTSGGGGPDPSQHSEHPGSPNLYTFLLLTLLELLALQLSYCLHHLSTPSSPARRAPAHRSVRKYRLPITAFFSLLQQACAIRSWLRVWGYLGSGSGSGGAHARATEAEEFGTVWLNKIPEILFEGVVGASVGLKALAALIRGEELSFENIVGHPAMSPTSEEDYPVALVKYCTHLLSTTRLSGLAYELHPLDLLPLSIALPLEDWGLVDPPPCDDDRCPVHGDEVRAARRRAAADERPERGVTLRRNGDVVFDEHDAAGALVGVAGGLRRRKNGQWAGGEHQDDEEPILEGFANEIRRITVEPHHGASDVTTGSTPFAPAPRASSSSLAHIEGERKSHLWVLVRVCARIALYLAWRAARGVRRAGRAAAARGLGWGRDEWEMERGWRAVEGERGRDEMREEREEEEEEEDGEWRPEREQDEEGSDWSSEEEKDGQEDWREEGEFGRAGSLTPDDSDLANPLALFSDLSTPSSATTATPAELAPYLLAHHLAASDAPPLTRRRYRALLPPSAPSSGPLSRASTPAAPTCRRSGTPSSSSLAPPAAGTAAASPALALSRAISSRRADVLASLAADDPDAARQELEHRRERWRDERARFCVVCTVNERSVVLWPCRCLCLCEDCRASLADRTTTAGSAAAAALDGGGGGGGGGSLCPTCRSPVQAFSRIWTP
ncbi:hypothetical protein Rhopal_006746-T1 [Rhodotorula paludigena]|uniref:RING-type domain-containing protein n=1 Tax=Rhodotorula paludigena TaxID=86838 RepID=A0AAV5GUS1_9BASI|nr:hypothetical protein Rhopal_006746-T1 [Rhodotorula paludigena]